MDESKPLPLASSEASAGQCSARALIDASVNLEHPAMFRVCSCAHAPRSRALQSRPFCSLT